MPNYWFPPEKSVVLSVQCAEIVETDQFEAGVTLRFPRVSTIRYDKAPLDVATIREIRDMKKKGLVNPSIRPPIHLYSPTLRLYLMGVCE